MSSAFEQLCTSKKIVAFVLIAFFSIPAIAQSTRLRLAETNSTITLSFVPDKQFPEDFRSIIFHSSGTTTRLTAHDQIIRIPATRQERKDAFTWSANAPGVMIDPSRYFMVGKYTVNAKPHTLLFFLSDAAASDAAPLLIIGFSDQGKPFKVFERPYELAAVEQTDAGALMKGSESISQAICATGDPKAPSSTTYDPYSVFLIQPDAKPIYLLKASRDYNLKHYVWAGPYASESVSVISNLPGHPKMFAASNARADHLMAKIKCMP
jgi:hypothetical protein